MTTGTTSGTRSDGAPAEQPVGAGDDGSHVLFDTGSAQLALAALTSGARVSAVFAGRTLSSFYACVYGAERVEVLPDAEQVSARLLQTIDRYWLRKCRVYRVEDGVPVEVTFGMVRVMRGVVVLAGAERTEQENRVQREVELMLLVRALSGQMRGYGPPPGNIGIRPE